MAGTGVRTDTATMWQSQNYVLGVAEDINADVSNLMNQLEPMLTDFQGAGGRTFQNIKADMNVQLVKLSQALATLAEAVGTSGTFYDATDAEAASLLAKTGAPVTGITNSLLIR